MGMACSSITRTVSPFFRRATETFFVERAWTPTKLVQAEDRNHRIGQKNKVTITYYDAAGTIDETINAMLSKKFRTAEEVLAGRTLSDQEIEQAVLGESQDMEDSVMSALFGSSPGEMRRNAAAQWHEWAEPAILGE